MARALLCGVCVRTAIATLSSKLQQEQERGGKLVEADVAPSISPFACACGLDVTVRVHAGTSAIAHACMSASMHSFAQDAVPKHAALPRRRRARRRTSAQTHACARSRAVHPRPRPLPPVPGAPGERARPYLASLGEHLSSCEVVFVEEAPFPTARFAKELQAAPRDPEPRTGIRRVPA